MEYMNYLYQHEELLMYLRFHPKWYKVLYYEPEMFSTFLAEAKKELGLRLTDKLDKFNTNISYLKLLSGFLNKGGV